MIRKLTENDREAVMEFLSLEPSINLFIIGDIELFGFNKESQEVWGSFDIKGKINGVLLRYNDNFIPYYRSAGFNDIPFKKIIKEYKGNTMISGKESIIRKYIGLLPDKQIKRMFFCELSDPALLKEDTEGVKIATANDADRVQELLSTITEFTRPTTAELIKKRIENQSGRVYYIEDYNGKVVSVAQTTAENSRSAMVIGVATAEGYRNRGYASMCLSKLCRDVLKEGKTICLFYDNPNAGSVYHKLGFESINNWTMIH